MRPISNEELLQLKESFGNATPFSYCAIQGLLDEEHIQQVREELIAQKYFEKSNDLYDFFQTEDLKLCTTKNISALRKQLYSKEFLSIIEQISGIALSNNVDMAGLKFLKHGNLLCHDDELEGRRIAYILYLTPEWNKEDGGLLELYSCTSDGNPHIIVQQLIPKWNNFVFFEVTPTSFHHVSEILGKNDRLSISGWFHGMPQKREKRKSVKQIPSELNNTKVHLQEWMNEEYLHTDNIEEMKEHFIHTSVLHLIDFLQKDKYDEMCKAFDRIAHIQVGPPQKKHYTTPELRSIIGQWNKILHSKEFALWLQHVTSLDVKKLIGHPRTFKQGDYTLLHDEEQEDAGLDLLYSCTQKYTEHSGGETHYLADDEVLLTIAPGDNTLTLVLRDQDTVKFTKYKNSSSTQVQHDWSYTYFQ